MASQILAKFSRDLSRLLAALAYCFVAGCGPGIHDLPAFSDELTTRVETFRDHDWALTLAENVIAGRVDYAHLAAHPEPLQSFLSLLEQAGPQSRADLFPARGQALAYYANAYNACVLRAVLEAKCPETMYDLGERPFEDRWIFLVDGRRQTLRDLRDACRRAAGTDARVEFCLCEPAMGGAPPPAAPLRFETLEDQLEAIARAALERDSILHVRHADRSLLVALAIHERREAFIEWYRRRMQTPEATLFNALNALASDATRAKLASAVGYTVSPLPFDRRLNRAGSAP